MWLCETIEMINPNIKFYDELIPKKSLFICLFHWRKDSFQVIVIHNNKIVGKFVTHPQSLHQDSPDHSE